MVGLMAERAGEEAGDLSRVFRDMAREEDEAADLLFEGATGFVAKGLYAAVAIWVLVYALKTVIGAYASAL